MSIGGGAIFSVSSDIGGGEPNMKDARMGERTKAGRYKMPLLPGESGPKSGGDWVSGGMQSMTNLASSISDTKALGDWKLEQALIGLGLHPELGADLRRTVYAAREQGFDFQNLRAHPELRTSLAAISERAWDIGGANAARDAGIAAHEVWEQQGRGVQMEVAPFAEEIGGLKRLLDRAGFEVLPHLIERVVRNETVGAAGRFDNILMHRPTGRLYIADLKTKRKPFWTFLEIDAQLAGYAYANWMLAPGGTAYEEGPLHHVDLEVGVVLHMPSDGGPPRLRKANLLEGWKTMQLAREVCTQRSTGRSVAHLADSWWPL